MAFLKRHDHCAERDVSAVLLVERNHRAIVHAVDMVAGKDEHIVAACLHDEAEILVDGVRGALVPI